MTVKSLTRSWSVPWPGAGPGPCPEVAAPRGRRPRRPRAVFAVYLIGLLVLQAALIAQTDFGPQLLAYVTDRYGEEAGDRIGEWEALIKGSAGLSEPEKLQRVNDFFNRLHFVSDEEHWGQRDYWASPLEFLGTDAGDCEDFSIAKYFTLRSMGVDDRKLRLTYVKALELRQAHMVLAYYEKPNSDPLILDNLIPQIRPGTARRDLLPVYSFNGEGLWRARERGQGRRVGSAKRLNLWRHLNNKMALEGDAIRGTSGILRDSQAAGSRKSAGAAELTVPVPGPEN